jgi:leucine dehydrogenase
MDIRNNPSFDGHEAVVPFQDEATGLAGVIALHSTRLGPAAGGCRMARYSSPEAALTDALRLSQGMSFKNAMADLPAGGGKAVLYAQGHGVSRQALFEAFGAAVEQLQGRYVTAEDVGTTVADMQAVARRTAYVAGLPARDGAAGGDPSPWTALGVFSAIEAASFRPLAVSRVAVQGLGSVGFKLCEHLHAAGARLIVADIDAERVARARRLFGAETASVETIHAVQADIFSPNALGASLNAQTIPDLGAPLVCGGANNQLANEEAGAALWARGVRYAPDYVVNAGGIINVMAEYLGQAPASVEPRVRAIGPRVAALLETARLEGRASHRVAEVLARAKIAARAASSAA